MSHSVSPAREVAFDAFVQVMQHGRGPDDAIDDFSKYMSVEYEKKTGVKIKPLLCLVVDGAE